MKLLPYGPRAVLAEFGTLQEVMSAATTWRAAAFPGVLEVVPAARTVLVVHDGSFLVDSLRSPAPGVGPTVEPAQVTIDVDYDGEDLAEVAATCGLSVAEVVVLHTSAQYSVAFCGFMPGFGYLVGLPAALHIARRATPRTRVPVGSVAIAAEFTGVYPQASPGGWHLLGRTDAELCNEQREPPALLHPGTVVRFRSR